MGMHTELLLKCRLRPRGVLPAGVPEVLDFLFNYKGPVEESKIPNHSFFDCARWAFIGSCSSYYHIPWSVSEYSEDYIFSRSDLKNYEQEIEEFLGWLHPYLDICGSEVIGWKWYEEDGRPTLIIADEKGIHYEQA